MTTTIDITAARQLLASYEQATAAGLEFTAREDWRALEPIADQLTRKLSCFDDLADLVGRWELHRYRPTIAKRFGAEHELLADLYDAAARQRGLDVVAYRG